ncbi:hypothetical protein ACTFIW_004699 [Dictyostelium discoideum]
MILLLLLLLLFGCSDSFGESEPRNLDKSNHVISLSSSIINCSQSTTNTDPIQKIQDKVLHSNSLGVRESIGSSSSISNSSSLNGSTNLNKIICQIYNNINT